VSEDTDMLARRSLHAFAQFMAKQARDERAHIMLRVKFREYRAQHGRLLLAHKALKHDYQALKFHYDALMRELAREEAVDAAAQQEASLA
jgi:ferritin